MPYSSRELLAAVPRLRRYARLLVDDPARADDMVAKTLARAHGAIRATERTQCAELLALLRSVHAEVLAGNSGPASPLAVAAARAQSEPSGAESDDGQGERVLAELRRLPLELREAVVLVAVERMSYDEVATILQVPVATVLSRLQQARDALRTGAVGRTPAHGGRTS
jgi:RNA polymerase sigma-70 factor, ECF subfamily